ncbi:hypothetical protein [Sansalvadorimonas verongulae]|uniref:hypothetical protein n=1 Tax=Sansalvadorimonas verongulae TaxID=2172824 RepID=UPI0012BD7AA7|nr:hypothetical protein [Sansalvadorimonas verongulae]MTI13034.1 hypothetical protein [Sansalvadorimonas verongulae]
MSRKMFARLPQLLLATALIATSPVALSSQALPPDTQGFGKVVHSSGVSISGLWIKEDRHFSAPISAFNLFSLDTKSCGILDFELSLTGLTCTNCRTNTAILKSCNIPRDNTGWHL